MALLLSFNEFDARHVQDQFLRPLALRAEEPLDPQRAAERPAGEQFGLGLECDRVHLGLDRSAPARLVLLRLVAELELDRRDAAGRVAQRPELKQPAAQLDPVQPARPQGALRPRAPSSTWTSPRASSARA